MSSRDKILSKVRAAKLVPEALPEVPVYKFSSDVFTAFCERLKGFDGEYLEFGSRAEALDYLKEIIDMKRAVYSALPDFEGNFSRDHLADPHQAHLIDVTVGEGRIGVGESGSVWVDDKTLGVPAATLLCTDLYLLLDKSRIYGTMHEAYPEIDFTSISYGAFFSGPSATADIEAVHITGAQGEISLTVLLY